MEADKVIPMFILSVKELPGLMPPHRKMILPFGSEVKGQCVLSMKSYVEDKPGYESIELLEDCDLYRLETENSKHSSMKIFILPIGAGNWLKRK
jgi:hypothetical protein